jgi:UDP-3-O-[3-hydroxymyristoyl] glucosamine N-acyltransferase
MEERTCRVSITVQQLAELVQGRVVGDGATVIWAARPLQQAGPGHITFFEDGKRAQPPAEWRASAVIARPGKLSGGFAIIEVEEPLLAFVKIHQHLHPQPVQPVLGVHATANIHPSVRFGSEPSVYAGVFIDENTTVGNRCRLYPGVVIGRNCRLGDDVTLHPNVVLYDGCTLGNRVIVHANAVVGKEGFGFRFDKGRHVRIPQMGSVEIGDDVEIGACTTIDRGTFQATRVGEGTKIDNLVQIAHNCQIGKHNIFASQVGIAGSSTTGDYVMLGGQVGVPDHVHIGDRAMVGAGSGLIADVPAGAKVLGSPALPEREAKVWYLNTHKVADLRREVQEIRKKLGME